MLKLMVIVLCHLLLHYVTRVLSAPVIKASGVEWSEPRGSGRGNITLIMIPHNGSCGNDSDSDVIVAVKSDYQVLSQDTQLLNLVVNEQSNTTGNGTRAHSQSCTTATPLDPGDELKCANTARYFLPAGKQPARAVSYRSENLLANGEQINLVRETTATVNVFKLLNLADPNGKNSFEATHPSTARSIHDLLKFINVSTTVSNENHLQSTAKVVGENKSEKNAFEIDSSDPFYNEALHLMDKLKQDPTYYESILVKPNPANTSEIGREREANHVARGGDMDLALEGEDTASDVDNKLGEIDPVIAACLSSTFSNEQSSIPPSVVPSTGEPAATAQTPDSSQTSTPEIAGIFPTTVGFISASLAAEPIALGGMEQGQTTEMCTTIILRCGTSTTEEPAVFNQIVNIVNATGRETTPSAVSLMESVATDTTAATSGVTVSKAVEVGSTVAAAEVMNAAGVGRTETSITCKESTTISQAEKLPRKITLEPRLNCDSLLKTNALTSSAEPSAEELSPFLESVVFLANKNDMSKGKEIPLLLNTSLDEFILTDLQDKSDRMHAAELYNSAPLEPGLGKIKPVDPSSEESNQVKSNEKRRVLIRNKSRDRGKIITPDLNGILKMKFGGKNFVLKQKPAYKYDVNDKQCDSTDKIKNDLPHSGLEPSDEEEKESFTEAKTELTLVKTQSTTLTQDVSSDDNEQNEQIKTTPHSPSDEESGTKNTFHWNKTTRKPISDESQRNDKGMNKIDRLNENEHSTTDKSTDFEKSLGAEDKPGSSTRTSTTTGNDRRTKPNSDSAKTSTSKFNVPQTHEDVFKESTARCESLYDTTTQTIVEESRKETEFSVAATTSTTRTSSTRTSSTRTSSTSSTTQRYDYHKDSDEDEDKTEEIGERGKVAARTDRNQFATNEEQTMTPVGDRTRSSTDGRCQTKLTGQNINIPANSLKEIVIKIIRTTREPAKGVKTDTDTCHSIERPPNDFRESNHGYKDTLISSNFKHQLKRPVMTGLDYEAPQSPTSGSAGVLGVLGGVQEQPQVSKQKASPFIIGNYGSSKRIQSQQNLQNGASVREICPALGNQKNEDPHLAGTHASPEQRDPYLAGTRASPEQRDPYLAGTRASPEQRNPYLAGTRASPEQQDSYLAVTRASPEQRYPYLAGTRASPEQRDSYLAGTRASPEQRYPYLAGTRASPEQRDPYLAGTRASPEQRYPYLAGTRASPEHWDPYLAASPEQWYRYPYLSGTRASWEERDPYLAGTLASSEQRYPSEQAKSSMNKPNSLRNLSIPVNMIVDRNGKSLESNILKLLLNDKSVIKTV